jgi:thioredoxin 1
MTVATPIPAVTGAGFDRLVLAGSRPTLVEFTAAWCPPCRLLAPVLAEVAAELAGRVTVVSVDVDEEPELTARFGVLAVPSLLLLDRGAERLRLVGARPRGRLLAELEAALA